MQFIRYGALKIVLDHDSATVYVRRDSGHIYSCPLIPEDYDALQTTQVFDLEQASPAKGTIVQFSDLRNMLLDTDDETKRDNAAFIIEFMTNDDEEPQDVYQAHKYPL